MKGLLKSFVYAGNGILWCIKNERNMRAHFSLCVYMYAYLLVYDFFVLSKTEWAIILLCNALVFSLEIVNTAVEKAVDLATEKQNPLAKISKDAAAGAVLVSAIFSVIVGLVILLQPEAFRAMVEYYKSRIYLLVILAASLVLTFAFILKGIPSGKKK
ncbi:MAG: diacylglycerol kinase family protein [Ruminococcaceae bacterium]|nr:diacylglycerol kinase family protein [Oscillospiraceae bacterium]